MSKDSSRQHYVPQFYLRQFSDDKKRLWVWDRKEDRVFHTRPEAIGAEVDFYLQPWLVDIGRDAQEMEHQLAEVEADAAQIVARLIPLVERTPPGEKLGITARERDSLSLFVALQSLRTRDARYLIGSLTAPFVEETLLENDLRDLHTTVLWDESVFLPMAERISGCTWLFGWNGTSTPFATSDNPVTHRKLYESRLWIRDTPFASDTDLALPLSSQVILYCYPKSGHYGSPGMTESDGTRSPVTLSEGMVFNENQGQVFSSERFVIQSSSDFSFMRRASQWMVHNYYDQTSPEWVELVSQMAVGFFPPGGWPWNAMTEGPIQTPQQSRP